MKSDRLTLVAFVLIVIIGGLNFVATRFSNRELPPFWGAGARIGAAALLLLAVGLIQRLPFPRVRALLGAVIYGVLGFGGSYALAYWAMLQIPAGLASIILASAPLLPSCSRSSRAWSGFAGGAWREGSLH